MNRILIALLIVLGLPALAFASPKPLLEGSFEITSARNAHGPEQQFAPLLLQQLPDAVWVRLTLTFKGTEITVGTQILQKEKGVYSGCRAAATTNLAWTRKGFTTASKVSAFGEFTSFTTLTAQDTTQDDQNCSGSFDAGAQVIGKDGARITLTSTKGGVLYLVPIDDGERPNWSHHLGGK